VTDNPNRSEKIALIGLLSAEGIGNTRAIELVRLFGSVTEVFSAPAGEISAAIKVPLKVSRSIVQSGRNLEKAEKVVNKIDQIGARIVTFWDSEYPVRLKTIPDPPVVLYFMGEPSPLYDYAVGVVGTRSLSDHAKMITPKIAGELAAVGVTVVSGMALGVDSLAHEGALRSGGRTIAVIGSGLDVIYPPSNRKLFERITGQGVVISEYPPGTKPDPHHFPKRNRIISGLSLGLVVIEGGKKSGALITARTAIEQGRELFAVPGAAGLSRSAGVNMLMKDGTAQMVESGEEVIEHLHSQLAPVLNVSATLTLPKLDEIEKKIYELLEDGPRLVDEIVRQSGINTVKLNQMITSMQLKGLIQRYSGARIGRT